MVCSVLFEVPPQAASVQQILKGTWQPGTTCCCVVCCIRAAEELLHVHEGLSVLVQPVTQECLRSDHGEYKRKEKERKTHRSTEDKGNEARPFLATK